MSNPRIDHGITQAIQRFISEILLRKEPRPPAGLELSFLPLARGMLEEEFSFLHNPGDRESACSFALLANTVPDSLGDWRDTGRHLWEVYDHWLDQFIAAPTSLTSKEQQELESAREFCVRHYELYVRYQEKYRIALDAYSYWKFLPEAERPADYELKLEQSTYERQRADIAWTLEGHRQEFDYHYERMVDLGKRDMSLSRRRLLEQRGEPIQSQRGTFFWTLVDQPDFYRSRTPWQDYHLTCQTQGTEPVKVGFQMRRVAIVRDWFMPGLLSTRAWKWLHSTAANPGAGYPLSDGMPNPSGHLIMYPTELLFVRSVTVKSRLRLFEDLPAHGGVTVGPFPFTATRPLRDARTGTPTGIASDELFLLCVLNQRLPRSPDPDWSLWTR